MRADKMVTNVQRNDIEQFLHDVRQYFIASLDTSEYENTSNMFHLTEAEQTANLLHRCDALLAQYSAAAPAQRQLVKNALSSMAASSTANGMKSNGSPLGGFVHRHAAARDCVDRPAAVEQPHQEEDATYLDMSAANTKQTIPSEAVDLNLSSAGDKALRYANINKGKRPEAPKVVPAAEEPTISINNSNNNGNNNNSNNNNYSSNNNSNNNISYNNNYSSNNNSNNNNYSSNNNSNTNNNSNNNIINNKSNNNTHQRVSLIPDSQSHHSREDKVPASTSCANSASTSASTDEDPDSDDDERQVYDICLVSQMDDDDAGDLDGGDGEGERQRVISQADSDVFASAVPCPYAELPAGHLAIQQSSKYGQLQRIERRLFFDQSKKCYGGILNDWLLLYADGPTSSAASQTLHLKTPGVEIEHYGEGKRRDVCFQISTGDPNKRFVFQAANEVDAKEWIHAIEAAIRSDTKAGAETAATPTNANTSRKLPTPPTLKRMTFISVGQNNNNNNNNNHNDCIYEEPEHLYAVHEQPTDLLLDDGKGDERAKQEAFNRSFEYDIPKSPPQPVLPPKSGRLDSPTEAEGFLLKPVTDSSGPVPKPSEGGSFRAKTPDSSGVFGKGPASSPLASPTKSPPVPSSTPPKSGGRHSLMPDKALDFQAKVKDVHHKLSSQLSAGLSPDRYRSKKAYTQCSNEMEFVAFNGAAADVTPPKHAPKDQKKPKKSDSPNGSAVAAAVTTPQPRKNSTASGSGLGEKSSKNWFLNRLNKSTSSTRSAGGAAAALAAAAASKSPGKHSGEKENLLNSLETYEHGGGGECQPLAGGNPASPILLKGGGGGGGGCGGGGGDGGGVGSKSKVNMIINQLEASGHLASMFSMDAFTTFCGGGSNGGVSANDCNNYEPIMTMSTPPTSLMKKV